MIDLIGHMLGKYQIESVLGEGGMAHIYRAYQPSMERYVAVKVLKADLEADETFVERFIREARLVAHLQHPYILPVIDFGETENFAYLVMILLEGGSLRNHLRERGALPLHRCTNIFTQIASALDYAHNRGIIHRDMKPANVLLDEGGNAYLTDFGIARLMESYQRLTATGVVIGTPQYISPEQAMGRPAEPRSDIYALGIMLYEMVTGQVPFNAETPYEIIFKHIHEEPILPRTIAPRVPEPVEAVILKAIEKDPRNRYQTPMQMADALAEAAPRVPLSAHDEEDAARQLLLDGQVAYEMSESAFMAPSEAGTRSTTPTLTPTRATGKYKIKITDFAGDPRAGIPCQNGFIHNAVRALDEIAGRQTTEIILRFADLEHVLDDLPPNDFGLCTRYNFQHYSDLNHAIVNYYGASGKEAAMHLGRVAARWVIENQPLFGFTSMALRIMPTAAAWRLALNRAKDTFYNIYNQAGFDFEVLFLEKPGFFLFALRECPCCVGKKSNTPICWMWEGLLIEAGAIVKGKTFPVEEIACQAMGAPYCVWRISKRPID